MQDEASQLVAHVLGARAGRARTRRVRRAREQDDARRDARRRPRPRRRGRPARAQAPRRRGDVRASGCARREPRRARRGGRAALRRGDVRPRARGRALHGHGHAAPQPGDTLAPLARKLPRAARGPGEDSRGGRTRACAAAGASSTPPARSRGKRTKRSSPPSSKPTRTSNRLRPRPRPPRSCSPTAPHAPGPNATTLTASSSRRWKSSSRQLLPCGSRAAGVRLRRPSGVSLLAANSPVGLMRGSSYWPCGTSCRRSVNWESLR